MPGTHYNNDHSFIEELPFDYKVIANHMIRDDPFERLLLNLRSLHAKAFDMFPVAGLTQSYKERIIHACVIAKITSFDKSLYIDESEESFISEVLFKSLRFVMKGAFETDDFTDEAMLKYLKVSHPKTYFWIHKSDKDERHTLAINKRFQNTRRYFRYRANLKYHFIRIGSHEGVEELQGDIYSTGIQHFNRIVNEKLDLLMSNYHQNIKDALAEAFPEAYKLFMVVIDRVEYLRGVLNGISVGQLPIDEAMRSLKNSIDHELDYASLKGNVRTESILRDFEEKIDQINEHTLTLLKKSTPHRLYEGPVLKKLKIDHDIIEYKEKRKKNKSSLLMSFIDLYHYTILLEKIYNNISASNYIIIFPEYWSENYHDVSQGGFSFFSEFLVEVNDILELFFQIDISPRSEKNIYEILHQRCKVVRIEERVDIGYYQIACQFLNPTETSMNIIRKATQSKEVKDAFDSACFMDEDSELD